MHVCQLKPWKFNQGRLPLKLQEKSPGNQGSCNQSCVTAAFISLYYHHCWTEQTWSHVVYFSRKNPYPSTKEGVLVWSSLPSPLHLTLLEITALVINLGILHCSARNWCLSSSLAYPSPIQCSFWVILSDNIICAFTGRAAQKDKCLLSSKDFASVEVFPLVSQGFMTGYEDKITGR